MQAQLRTLLRQGERALRLGKNQAAESVYRQAVDHFPDSAEAWLGLSQSAADEGDRLQALQRAQQLDPGLEADAVDNIQPAPAPSILDEPSSLDVALAESQSWLNQTTSRTELSADEAPDETTSPPVMEPASLPAVEQEQVAFCHYHPNTETSLRCNRCSKPICVKCARKTPVGYRCKECIKEQQEVFYSAYWYDYLLAAVVTIPLAAIASFIITGIGWLTIFVAPFTGVLVAEVVRLVTRRRRGRWLPLVVGACMVLAALPLFAVGLLGFLVDSSLINTGMLMEYVWLGVYLVLAVSSAYYRVK